MKVSAKAYLFATQYSWQDEPEYTIFGYRLADTENQVFIKEFDVVDIEIPESFNPTAQRIAALEAQKAKSHADFVKSVADIEDRIKKLTAIEYTA